MIPKLDVADLRFGYHRRPVLKDIGFTVAPGRLVSLVGPNGSGKSTLLKCLLHLLKPQGGRVRVDGREIHRLSRLEVARTLTYVPQKIQRIFPHSVFDVVYMGRRPHLGWRGGRRHKERTWEVLSRMGLADLAVDPFTELSGGQQQKVLIARALAQETSLILLDEPTSNLDIWHQLDVLNMVRELVDRKAVTVVMALHDLNLAAKYSDTILMLKAGRLTALGEPRAVLTPENIASVYKVDTIVAATERQPYVIPIRQRAAAVS
jgi:iron complex transport system ATP-binding protein